MPSLSNDIALEYVGIAEFMLAGGKATGCMGQLEQGTIGNMSVTCQPWLQSHVTSLAKGEVRENSDQLTLLAFCVWKTSPGSLYGWFLITH